MTQPAALARIHGRHELEAGREIRAPRCAGDADVTAFERLAQGFQHASVEFGKLVEKEHAVM